ncbi:MAG: NINE protein [Flavobacteriales bacterium]|nr:NINE protein [Flavobacteriales bacterium]
MFSLVGFGQTKSHKRGLRIGVLKEVTQVIKFKKKLEVTENPRAVAAITTVLLGPFGAHRIYLGTETKVPIFYTLTLGGGLGILPLIDLICILTTKDLEQYYNNPKVIMWAGER